VVGTVESNNSEDLFEQVWGPIDSGSNVPPTDDVEALVVEFAGVVSRDKVQRDSRNAVEVM